MYLFLAVLGLRFCARAFSSCGKWGPLFIALRGPLTIAASLVAEHRLQTRRLSNLWLTGPVAPRHAGSSQTRARTRVPCIGRQILNHCATREAPLFSFILFFSSPLECVCVYVYVCIYMYMCMYVYIYVYTYVYMYIFWYCLQSPVCLDSQFGYTISTCKLYFK